MLTHADAQAEERAKVYHTRMKLLSDVIDTVDAPIIAFQEVRYDMLLGQKGSHFQMKHLMDRLPKYVHR